MHRAAAQAAIVLGFWVTGAEAAGREPTGLVYRAEDSRSLCPDEASFRALVTARMGRDPFSSTTDPNLGTMKVTVSQRGTRLLGRVAKHEPPMIREVAGTSGECEVVVEALASIAAMALDPEAVLRPSPPALPSLPPPPPGTTPDPREPPMRTPAVVPAQPSASPIRFHGGAAFATSLGLLPAPSLGAEVAAGVRTERIGFLALGRAETQTAATASRGVEVEASFLGGGALACGHVRWGFGCLVALGGVLNGRAPQAEVSRLGANAVVLTGARVGLELPLGGGLAMVPHVGVWIPVVRTTLSFADAPVWTAPPIAGTLGVGLSFSR